MSEYPIILIDGTDASLEKARSILETRPGTPCLIFPMFWGADKTKKVFEFVDKAGIQAFFFTPQEVEMNGDRIKVVYRTNEIEHITDEAFEPDKMLEAYLKWESAPTPKMMWTEIL